MPLTLLLSLIHSSYIAFRQNGGLAHSLVVLEGLLSSPRLSRSWPGHTYAGQTYAVDLL